MHQIEYGVVETYSDVSTCYVEACMSGPGESVKLPDQELCLV